MGRYGEMCRDIPMREISLQVGREFAAVAPTLTCCCVYGGAPIGAQCSELRRGVDVLVGTPGRVKDLMGLISH